MTGNIRGKSGPGPDPHANPDENDRFIFRTDVEHMDIFRNLFLRIPDPAYIWTRKPDGRILLNHYNKAAVEITSGKIKDYLGMELETFFDHAPSRIECIRNVIENGVNCSEEGEYTYKTTGKTLWIQLEVFKISEDSAIAITKNIQNLKLTIKALEESEKRFQTLFAASPDVHIVADDSGNIVMANQGSVQIFGFKNMEELLCRTTTSLYDSPSARRQALDYLENERFLHNWRILAIRADGTRFPALLSATKIQMDNRDYYYGQLKDITEYEILQNALTETETRYRRIMESMNDGILFLNREGTVLAVNRSACRAIGVNPQDLLSKPIDIIAELNNTKNQLSELRAMLDLVPPFTREIRIGDPEKMRIYEISCVAIDSDRLYQIRDICDRKRFQQEKRRSERMELTSRISSQIAHDFNNLLSPLIGLPEVIESRIEPSESISKMLRLIQEAAGQLSEINQQLMTFSRTSHYSLAPIDINSVITMVDQLKIIPESVRYEMRLEPGLKPVKGNKTQLVRVILNLVNNAIEAMPQGGNLTVSTETVSLQDPVAECENIPTGTYTVIHVADSGCGIDPQLKDLIFEPFFSTKQLAKRQGLGLGLNVVDEIVKDFCGTLFFTRNPTAGVTFHVYFPVTRETEQQSRSELHDLTGSESILLVDDNPIHLETIRHMLVNSGFRVEMAEKASEAIRMFEEQAFDLVILDMVMPEMDGTDLYRLMSDRIPGQKAIILSAYAQSDRVKLALELGVGKFLRKPVDYLNLLDAVREILGSDNDPNPDGSGSDTTPIT